MRFADAEQMACEILRGGAFHASARSNDYGKDFNTHTHTHTCSLSAFFEAGGYSHICF